MAVYTKLQELKIRLGIKDNSKDDLLSLLISDAEKAILNRLYPYENANNKLPMNYKNKQLEIAIYLYNRQGSEGEISHNENGISRSYESSSIPNSMLKDIVPYCGVVQ